MAQPQQAYKEDRSIGELFSELAGETGTLVRQELSLAQVELTKKAASVGTNVGYLAVGGAVGYAGFLAILAGVIIGVSHFIPAWLAAILIGAIVAGTAYFLVMSAIEGIKKTGISPTETVESIKEDAKWLKDQVNN
ncbi:MAG: phage holin family protein [Pyrinomonadaceae bacterium]